MGGGRGVLKKRNERGTGERGFRGFRRAEEGRKREFLSDGQTGEWKETRGNRKESLVWGRTMQ